MSNINNRTLQNGPATSMLLTDIEDVFNVSVKFEMLVTDLGC